MPVAAGLFQRAANVGADFVRGSAAIGADVFRGAPEARLRATRASAGKTKPAIAEKLGLQPSTVAGLTKTLYQTLDIHTTGELGAKIVFWAKSFVRFE